MKWLDDLEALEKAATPEPWEYDSVPLERNELGDKTLGPSAIPPRYHLLQTADVHPQLKAKLPIVGIATGPYYDPKKSIFIREQDGKLMAASRNALPRLIAIAKAAGQVAAEDWGTSCSENCHYGRIAKMDALRAALEASE